jgi:hypothetical protein
MSVHINRSDPTLKTTFRYGYKKLQREYVSAVKSKEVMMRGGVGDKTEP